MAAVCHCLSLSSEGQERTVRVGVFEFDGFYSDSNGVPQGYGADYLNRIAALTGWSYEYVWAPNWEECVHLLREGKVDLIAPAQETEYRQQEFAFSNFWIGIEYGGLLALDTNDSLVYEDFSSFDNMKTGYMEGSVILESCDRYSEDNGFRPQMIPYEDINALMEALRSGQVDSVLVNLFRKTDVTKILAKFGASPIYFMTGKNQTALLHDLNDALQQLNTEQPAFNTELAAQYYPYLSYLPFTKAELEYIESAPVLTVGCRSDMAPVSYVDGETGEPRGITIDILDQISHISGLKFQYAALPQGPIDYPYLTGHRISLVSSVEYNPANQTAPGIRLTNPYLDSKKVFICRKGLNFDTGSPMNLAISTGSQTLPTVINEAYPNFKITLYKDMESCFEAVRDGKADALLQNQYVVNYYLSKPRYENMKTIPAESLQDEMCLSPVVYKPDGSPDSLLSDDRLVTILNKSINQLSDQDITRIIIRETAEYNYDYTYRDFLYQYRYPLLAMAAVLAVLGALIIYAVTLRRRSMAMIRRNEEQLRNITNNINGGVVVLSARGALRITYANDGFMELLHLKKDDFGLIKNKDYTTYVHPDDLRLLEPIARMSADGDSQVSFKIRIMRSDGNYIPVLFNGTLAEHASGQRILYCVIMDISEEEQLVEKLSLEQKKYGILMRSSGDIMFEVDCSTRRLTMSPLFRQKFGREVSCAVSPDDIPHYLSFLGIKEEDLEALEDVTRQMLIHKDSVDAAARIMRDDGSFIWCRIFQYPMLNADGELVYIMGRILDINDEVLEKERLERQSRADPLTGLLNKTAFFAEAEAYLGTSPVSNTALIFMDLDNFKQINDSLGHMIGDTAIKDAARKLQVIFSSYDILARFGGDEFCVLLKEIPVDTLKDKLSWTIQKMKAVYSAEGIDVAISASIGAACTWGGHGQSLDTLLMQADKALYTAKKNGKDRYVIYR